MHIKFLPHSTGVGQDAIDYLLGARDHKGNVRAGVQVLRGDPYLTGQLIDSLKTVHRYSSAVIAWELDDAPTDEQIDEAVDGFIRAACAGLDPSQYDVTAVRHIDADGSTHIHVVIPRLELTSGRSMNVAPPGWTSWVGPLRNALNFKFGWARPDDPRRARNVQQPKGPMPPAARERKEDVVDALVELVRVGVIKNRDDVLKALAQYGEITRAGRDYVSVKEPGAPKAMRFKGLLFVDGELDCASILAAAKRQVTADAPVKIPRDPPNRAAAAVEMRALRAVTRSRARFNRERYPRPAIEPALLEIDDARPDFAIIDAGKEAATPAVAFAADRARAAAAVEAARAVDDLLTAARAAFDRTRAALQRVGEELRRAGRALGNAIRAADRLGEAVAAGQVAAPTADPLARMRAALDRLPAGAAPDPAASTDETPAAPSSAPRPRPPGRR